VAKPVLPPTPPKPGVGDLVGRIQLPPRPARPGDKVGSVKLPGRPNALQPRQDQQRGGGRTDFRSRGGTSFTQRQQGGGYSAPARPASPAAPAFVAPETGEMITLKPPIIVRDLAEQLKRKPHQIIADLMGMNVWATVNHPIEETIAQRLCAKYGFRFEVEKRKGGGGIHVPVTKVELDVDDKLEDMKFRPPVVTIMGHVDHGKTTLLDVIRKSDVAAGEAGGITQHIGAYTIAFPHPERKGELQQLTFLDTPGHAAFSAMRARGANVTDIVVLVVAANDGVMPQTIEAMNHAKAAHVPIIVAVNKTDHPNANPLKARQQLQDKGLIPDDWGGDTIFVDVSALTKQGVDKLLELILLQADMLELKANPNRRAKGNIIESGQSPGGPTATVLVRKGTLRVGDIVICGPYYGRVRALIDAENKRLKEAGPSIAVSMLGLNGIPEAGSDFSVVENEKAARELADKRVQEYRAGQMESRAKVTLENLFQTLDESSNKVLKLVVKADMQGSVEAIVDALKKIDSTKVSIEIIHSAVGTITESDVDLASASKAIIIGFHTRIDVGVSDVAKREGVQIKLYSIIYELIDEVKLAMAGLLEPILKETVVGSAEIRKIFELSKGGKVAGCVVSNGRIVRGKVRVMRRKSRIYEGAVTTLRRFQDDVNEVRAGMECGIRVEGFDQFMPGDVVESFIIEKVAPTL
jgi:translation initiation factor IF-2